MCFSLRLNIFVYLEQNAYLIQMYYYLSLSHKDFFFPSLVLTSAWYEHCVALSLDILFVALSWQCHSALAGMKLAVDLCTGPCQHLTVTKETTEVTEEGVTLGHEQS